MSDAIGNRDLVERQIGPIGLAVLPAILASMFFRPEEYSVHSIIVDDVRRFEGDVRLEEER